MKLSSNLFVIFIILNIFICSDMLIMTKLSKSTTFAKINNLKCFTDSKYIIVPNVEYISNYKSDLIQKRDIPKILKGKLYLDLDSVLFNSFSNTSILVLNLKNNIFPVVYTFTKAILLRQPINIHN